MLQLLSYMAQSEREFIFQRKAERIVTTKRRGVPFGRKPMECPSAFILFTLSTVDTFIPDMRRKASFRNCLIHCSQTRRMREG